ncbi:hypothetical protein Gpo141_00008479 [Globisporangium polare]
MASPPRMDLEARLRALRAPKGRSGSTSSSLPSTSPSTVPPPAVAAAPVLPIAPADAIAWPEAPVAAGLPWPDPPTVKPRRSSSGVLGEVMVIPRRSSVSAQSSSSRRFQPPEPQQQQQQKQPQQSTELPQPTVETASGVSVASLLGPAYSEAVQIAQQAIESERNRHAYTAIDLYIRAGQQLISIGRQQHTAHLQTIVRKKALALLERAEGLSDWVSSVQAVDSSEEAMSAAFAGAQREREQALTEKEALVAKMKSENSKMSQKLNQLVLLTKVRTRFRRIVSDRRARKAEEALRSASLEDSNNNTTNDVEGEDEPQEGEDENQQRRSSFSSSTSSLSSLSGHITNQTPQEREAQKRDLVNELHSRIGLPEISTLRKFTPLSSDAMKDIRHVELEDELETARLEAERLRAAVQEMEECFQATLEQTRQQSLKITQEKEQNLAQMEDELLRVRSELERERRLTASSFGGSNRSNQSTNDRDGEGDDLDSYEDVAMIRSLRSSLHLLGQNPAATTTTPQDNNNNNNKEDGQPGGECTAPTMKRGWSTSESEDDSDVDEDGGVWL